MPLNAAGKKIMRNLRKEYGDRAQDVFYAMLNSGKLPRVEARSRTTRNPKNVLTDPS